MIFNLSYGGGSGSVEDAYAVISVTYPAGSTCTCKKSNIEFTAENQSGKVMFAIPESGTWTVACTDGTNSDSEDVTVSQYGAHNVTLEYTHPAPTPTTGSIYAYGGYGAYNYEGGPSVPVIDTSATFSNLAPGTYLVVWVPSPNTGAKYANVTVTAGKTTSIDMTTGSSSQDGGDDEGGDEPTPSIRGTITAYYPGQGSSVYWSLLRDDEESATAIGGSSQTWSNLELGHNYSVLANAGSGTYYGRTTLTTERTSATITLTLFG